MGQIPNGTILRIDVDAYINPAIENDAAPIAATHGRPVQYSQDHAYGQEAPARLPRSFLAEGPRASRALSASRASSSPSSTAVARLGPRPVADGHLVDVAALAAPPCGLAAYGLHAGGLQALAHARVPHRRYAGMRDGQVVEAGEHLASRAVRAAVVDAHEAHAHLLAPDVAARSAPPHHGACVGVEVLGAQAAVQLGVELPGDVRPL